MNGLGVYKWPNGNTYVGEFLNDQMHGEGVFSFATNSCKY